VKVRRQSRSKNQSHARHADATGTPSCSASPRALAFAESKATGSFPFSFHPPRFYLHGSRSSRSFLTAIHLEPLRFYLFGRLEKITQGLRPVGIEHRIKQLANKALFAFGKALDLLKLTKQLL
jgi:hypothetical protein